MQGGDGPQTRRGQAAHYEQLLGRGEGATRGEACLSVVVEVEGFEGLLQIEAGGSKDDDREAGGVEQAVPGTVPGVSNPGVAHEQVSVSSGVGRTGCWFLVCPYI